MMLRESSCSLTASYDTLAPQPQHGTDGTGGSPRQADPGDRGLLLGGSSKPDGPETRGPQADWPPGGSSGASITGPRARRKPLQATRPEMVWGKGFRPAHERQEGERKTPPRTISCFPEGCRAPS